MSTASFYAHAVRLNAAIRALLDELNDRPLQKLGVSGRALYDRLDGPALLPRPTARYVVAQWKRCRVNIDYPGAPGIAITRSISVP